MFFICLLLSGLGLKNIIIILSLTGRGIYIKLQNFMHPAVAQHVLVSRYMLTVQIRILLACAG